jgi:hypothetical protein
VTARPPTPDGGDEQDLAEGLDDDTDLGEYPPDRLQGAGRAGTTASEAAGGESVAERDVRYDHRQDLREAPLPMAGLIDVEDGFDADHTEELVAERGDEPDSYSAEEQAVHVVEEE